MLRQIIGNDLPGEVVACLIPVGVVSIVQDVATRGGLLEGRREVDEGGMPSSSAKVAMASR
ncbi:MAG: hypothetical protein U0694_13975 [Anaerolineae bacterium]